MRGKVVGKSVGLTKFVERHAIVVEVSCCCCCPAVVTGGLLVVCTLLDEKTRRKKGWQKLFLGSFFLPLQQEPNKETSPSAVSLSTNARIQRIETETRPSQYLMISMKHYKCMDKPYPPTTSLLFNTRVRSAWLAGGTSPTLLLATTTTTKGSSLPGENRSAQLLAKSSRVLEQIRFFSHSTLSLNAMYKIHTQCYPHTRYAPDNSEFPCLQLHHHLLPIKQEAICTTRTGNIS